MKKFLSLTVLFLLLGAMTTMTTSASENTAFYGLSAPANDGKKVSLSQYKGKTLLIVNTASQCGYTPQYKGLQKLQEKFQNKGFQILGFPSNDFGGQEPGSNEEIKKFCELKYHTTFPLFAKDHVTGSSMQPVYEYLTEKTASEFRGEVKWNFEKFLIDRNGNVLARFRSKVEPDSEELTSQIEKALATK
jgi:glutathione peroxidase